MKKMQMLGYRHWINHYCILIFILNFHGQVISSKRESRSKGYNCRLENNATYEEASRKCREYGRGWRILGDHRDMVELDWTHKVSALWLPFKRKLLENWYSTDTNEIVHDMHISDTNENRCGAVDEGEKKAVDCSHSHQTVCVMRNCSYCPVGFENSICHLNSSTELCIYIFGNKLPWFQARSLCKALGTDLLPYSLWNELREEELKRLPPEAYWLGLTKLKWINDTNDGKEELIGGNIFWADEEPSKEESKNCSIIRNIFGSKPEWKSEICDKKYAFACCTSESENTNEKAAPETLAEGCQGKGNTVDMTLVGVFVVFIILMLGILGGLLWTMKKNNQRLSYYMVRYQSDGANVTTENGHPITPVSRPERARRPRKAPMDRMATRPPPPVPQEDTQNEACPQEASSCPAGGDKMSRRSPVPAPGRKDQHYQRPRGTAAAVVPLPSSVVEEENPIYRQMGK